jgi:ribosomal protein S12 methylthiotransferase accessory factor
MSADRLSRARLRHSPIPDLDEALLRARRLVSPRTGLITKVEWVERAPRDPAIWWARSVEADTRPVFGRQALNEGNASALDPRRAMIKAIGESIERYSAAAHDPSQAVLATARQLGPEAIPPARFALFAPDQYADPAFPCVPFTEDTPVCWVRGWNLTADRPAWVPAAFVYIPYSLAPGEARVVPAQVSTGLAAHATLYEAVRRALLEVIERDAFMTCWSAQLSSPALSLDGLSNAALGPLAALTEQRGYRFCGRVLSLDVAVPVILGAFVATGPHIPLLTVGTGADADPVEALRQALEEAFLSLHGITRLAESEPDFVPAADGRNIRNLRHHALAHAVDPALHEGMLRWLRPEGELSLAALPRPPIDGEQGLSWLIEELDRNGMSAYAVDITPSDIHAAGFAAARVLVPEMQPLDVDHQAVHRGGPRPRTLPARLGRGRSPIDWNPLPHPFP